MIQTGKTGLTIAAAAVCFLISTSVFAGDHADHSVMKKEADGRVSKENFMKHHEWMFDQEDKNKDGYIDNSEMNSLHNKVKGMHERFESQHKN